METLTDIALFYETHFASLLPEYGFFAPIYGWLATASVVVAILAVVFVIFNRERGLQAATVMGQHVLVYAAPIFIGRFLTLG